VVSIPLGLSNDGLPLSMQVVGKPFDEITVLQVADAYERARGPLPLPKI
jgi:aspartyl-tRNA(Asn)/glutamyl-tRNA(Gln) amidotransferase subunit A